MNSCPAQESAELHPLFWLAFCLVGGTAGFRGEPAAAFFVSGENLVGGGIFPYAHRKKSGDKRNYWNIEKRNESVIL